MPSIAITGSTGQLGRATVTHLLDRGVPAADLVALARTPAAADDLAARGVTVRAFDYDQPETLAPALDGVDRLLLVSGSEPGRRIPQHTAVIEAARTAGVGLLAYTSILNAETTRMQLAAEHQETERLIADSGLPAVLLRNGWYTENYTRTLDQTIEHGALVGAAASGRVGLAARDDYALAAAVVLAGEGHAGRAYELSGPAITLAELAATISTVAGREIPYRPLAPADYEQLLVGAGLPAPVAAIFADVDVQIDAGALEHDGDDLERLIGRPVTPVADTVRAALA
ncbi:SDR family oxidoreductase [Paraconexibacter algicola]|uniref:NAD(P)-dependent oxidoreductase n=1 Tax=Paraconexibacter algicola TaxID=2133960 RepID=A0A2T4UII4_9ACTN|nr:SDR family oxidoreductase [Paraconexibacter algicola]PTL59042.1 NAD(P)-dependent oxidoreductase [Paraconexibacter algicola]